MPTNTQQLSQSDEYSCLLLVGCIPAWGEGPFCICPSVPQDCGLTLVLLCGLLPSANLSFLRLQMEGVLDKAQGCGHLWHLGVRHPQKHRESLHGTHSLSSPLWLAGWFDPLLPPCSCSGPFFLPGMPCLLFQGLSKAKGSAFTVSEL